MKQIIKDGRVVDDDWQLVGEAEAARVGNQPMGPTPIVPLRAYLAQADRLATSSAPMGVLIEPDGDLDALLPCLDHLALIAVYFPGLTDGRGYSIGRLIRMRYRFTGELRAVGDILRDQLYFLSQCGFNAFELRNDQDLGEALSAFHDYAWQPNSRVQETAGRASAG